MNKKTIITSLIIFIVLIGGIFGAAEYLSYKTVHVIFKESNLAIDIYNNADNKQKASLSDSGDIKLKEGSYYYKPTTDSFSHDKVYFMVTSDDTTVEISPAYSSSRLNNILSTQEDTIHTVITTTYATIINNYIISDETLYHHGEWYSARLVQRVEGSNEPDVYRVILKKDGDSWKIAASPRLTISIKEFSNIPEYVIRQVNKSPSTQALDSSRAS